MCIRKCIESIFILYYLRNYIIIFTEQEICLFLWQLFHDIDTDLILINGISSNIVEIICGRSTSRDRQVSCNLLKAAMYHFRDGR